MGAGSPKSAAIYARISHDPSGERLGVQRQEADCLEEASRRGWSIAQVYVDDDLSAFNPSKARPEYQRLLTDIQLGSRDGVMIWRLDRLHRQPRELEEFIVLCDKHHVALATVTGDVDLSTSQGRLLARTWGAFAAHESEIKSERMTRANLERARQGIMRTPRPLYGYTARATAIKPGEAKVIREAAGRLLLGDSLRGICMDLNARRIPSPRKAFWQAPALHDILGNPRLAGLSTYHGEVVGKGAWKAILTRRESERIRSLLSDPERVVGDGTRHSYLLTGLAHCGRCGERLRTAGVGVERSYRCAQQAGRKGCGRLSITMDHLDAMFMDRLYERLDSTSLPTALQRGRLRSSTWRRARSSLDDAEARLRSMAREYALGTLTRMEWRAARPVLIEQLNAMRKALRDDRAEDIVSAFVGHADALRRTWDELPPSRRRAIAAALAEEVVVWPAPSTRARAHERTSIWWRDEVRPRAPRDARKGVAERRAAGAFDHCSVDSCPEPYYASGYCFIHTHRLRRHGEPGAPLRQKMPPYRGALCSSGGCERTAVAVGWCQHHYYKWKRDDLDRPRCSVPGCEQGVRHLEWCGLHYQRVRKTGTTDPRPQTRAGCR
jgi:site-specific DNA recombinase